MYKQSLKDEAPAEKEEKPAIPPTPDSHYLDAYFILVVKFCCCLLLHVTMCAKILEAL